jgi:hypothetical protein
LAVIAFDDPAMIPEIVATRFCSQELRSMSIEATVLTAVFDPVPPRFVPAIL